MTLVYFQFIFVELLLLGRGLTSAEPQPDLRKLDKCKVIGSELVAARCDPAALFDLVEEAFDPVAGAV